MNPKILKVSVESSAVHWLKIKEECKLNENEGFVPSRGNSLRNLRQAGHMVVKGSCEDTQGHTIQTGAKLYCVYMVSDLVGICIGP